MDVVEEPPACLNLTGDGQGGFVARDHRGRGLRLRVVALSADMELPTLPEQASPESPARPERQPVAVADLGKPVSGSKPSAPADGDCHDDRSLGPARTGVRHPNTFREPSAPPAAILESSPPPRPRRRRTRPAHLDSPSTGGLLCRWWASPCNACRPMRRPVSATGGSASIARADWCWITIPTPPPGCGIDSADRLFGEVVGLSAPLELPACGSHFPSWNWNSSPRHRR